MVTWKLCPQAGFDTLKIYFLNYYSKYWAGTRNKWHRINMVNMKSLIVYLMPYDKYFMIYCIHMCICILHTIYWSWTTQRIRNLKTMRPGHLKRINFQSILIKLTVNSWPLFVDKTCIVSISTEPWFLAYYISSVNVQVLKSKRLSLKQG